ncbi:MAG: WXG100 family type VII secretion target [Chloroflexales bacterium]
MSSIIRANTDQLRSVARQMRGAADQILADTGASAREMEALAETWSGSARNRGMARWAEIHPRYQPAAEQLNHFASELDGLAARLEEAARVFGDGSLVPWDANGDAVDAPQDMAALFDQLDPEKSGGNEIQIYQVGPNQFAVLLEGSDDASGGMNSLTQDAFPAGMGQDTEYAQKVRSMLTDLAKKYPGANIDMVGYSQGGIIAQSVASNDQFFRDTGLNLNTISTYGTPRPLEHIDPSKYYQDFDAPFDIVSSASPRITPESILTTTLFRIVPIATVVGGVIMHTNGYKQDWSPTRQAMRKTPPPFNTKKWVRVDKYDDQAD